MTSPVWQATVTDDTGDVLPGAQIDVVIESTGTDATLFRDRAGTISLSNPFFADSGGFAQFYTDAGTYRITATASGGGTTRTWRYVSLFDFDANVGTAAGEVPRNSDLGSASLVDAIGTGDLYGRDSILGTVSETAGVPTGSIIQTGSNSDGEYTMFANGDLECTITSVRSVGFLVETDVTGLLRSGHVNLTFPRAFVGSLPNIQSSIIEESANFKLWGGNTRDNLGLSDGSFIFFGAIGASATISVKVSITAKGKWY